MIEIGGVVAQKSPSTTIYELASVGWSGVGSLAIAPVGWWWVPRHVMALCWGVLGTACEMGKIYLWIK